ncbi:Hypothetical predicted protein, partial [Pelobates cultripes]
ILQALPLTANVKQEQRRLSGTHESNQTEDPSQDLEISPLASQMSCCVDQISERTGLCGDTNRTWEKYSDKKLQPHSLVAWRQI